MLRLLGYVFVFSEERQVRQRGGRVGYNGCGGGGGGGGEVISKMAQGNLIYFSYRRRDGMSSIIPCDAILWPRQSHKR